MRLPLALTLLACLGSAHAQTPTALRCDASVAPSAGRVQLTEIARGLENPWALTFLPDGRMLVSERPGRLRIVTADGKLSAPLAGAPAVMARGQGGLLDVALDPEFARNRIVYLGYAEAGEGGAGTAIARARLDDAGLALRELRVIYRQTPKVSGNGHFGVRFAFGADGKLYAAFGERQKFEPAQDPQQSLGKVLRLNPDGSVPADNPFAGRAGWLPELYSLGHRNPQGLTREPGSDRLWLVEHGARGGDEINLLSAGSNYGWPVISYGVHYTGFKIGEGQSKPGMAQPQCYWDPSIAPGNLVFHTGDKAAGWRGNLFVAALKDQAVHRLTLDGSRITGAERIPVGKRVRDIRVGPDGGLYLTTDETDGQILRLSLQ
ncbi:PQQ-dependent sugar dehydrogenase [Uliginosibacterium sp. 31-16]|uniref:PQQ-dependent sugar dehydrogenase n=1 Tax=Uliginosibacterium sp. 31-16 TaxID=3068315 RepID=UPI00273EFD96|nr:PQQ-dependent sugar dehydrogenase [Uliginosibacterium sp. 31-16]MDP5239182.1 PQQ-dependent sugar dehydrogenase [Uliginosibacterium sp. 31-16]